MELRQLRHLIAVVEHGSFSRAAEAVHLTQPALSRSIQALEAEVGAAVLERNRGAIVPTDMGHLLLTHARLLDTVTRDLERDIALTQGLELGELRIGVGPYGGSALVGPAIGQLNLPTRACVSRPSWPRGRSCPTAPARAMSTSSWSSSARCSRWRTLPCRRLTEHAMVVVCQPRHPLALMDSPTWPTFSATRWPGPASPRRFPACCWTCSPRASARSRRSAACWRWNATCRACSRTCCATATPSR
jgi:DNA-binding transcriptional LysR family regulator